MCGVAITTKFVLSLVSILHNGWPFVDLTDHMVSPLLFVSRFCLLSLLFEIFIIIFACLLSLFFEIFFIIFAFRDFVYYLCFSRFWLLSLFFEILFMVLLDCIRTAPFSNTSIRFKVLQMSMAISLIFKSISICQKFNVHCRLLVYDKLELNSGLLNTEEKQ